MPRARRSKTNPEHGPTTANQIEGADAVRDQVAERQGKPRTTRGRPRKSPRPARTHPESTDAPAPSAGSRQGASEVGASPSHVVPDDVQAGDELSPPVGRRTGGTRLGRAPTPTSARRDRLEAESTRSEQTTDGGQQLEPPEGRLARSVTEKRQREIEYARMKERLRAVVDSTVPPDARLAVVSRGDDDLLDLGDRPAWHFPSDDGGYLGFHPRDDGAAIAYVEAIRARGADYLVFPATYRWWLRHYRGLADHLEEYQRTVDNEACTIFDLSTNHSNRPSVPPTGQVREANASSAPVALASTTISEIQIIAESGLFDHEFYCGAYLPDSNDKQFALVHFCEHGWRLGNQPNPYFDTAWYIRTYGEALVRENPLADYIESGETRQPSLIFDPAFFASSYGRGQGRSALAEYLHGTHQRLWRNPISLFDVDYYLAQYQDVTDAGVDPVLHYVHQGYREGRDPSPEFSTDYYRRRYLNGSRDVNPLIHYFEVGRAEGHATRSGEDDGGVHAEVRRWVAAGSDYEDVNPTPARAHDPRAKAIAFYLPQFHTFPENDEWWGEGFTEWRNVGRGIPRFRGHYQPRIPRDLGFYDLTDVSTMNRQVQLAEAAGLHGFSFYYYWFNGRRLLDTPLDRFAADESYDFEFCLTWANENWTRRWDGYDKEILIAQDYSEAQDHELVDDVQRYFSDRRYIRIDGRPLWIIYRADIIPDLSRTIQRWRDLWSKRHGENPLIFVAQAFGVIDPTQFGADGAIEFPPHKVTQRVPRVNDDIDVLDPAFQGHVYDYAEVAAEAIAEPYPPFPLIKTAVPSWDNEARRQGSGLTLRGSTPGLYEEWLSAIVRIAERHPVYGESIVFINAWNEWAEGAYLEPDVHYGAAYLNATGRALCRPRPAPIRRKVLLVGHDAHAFGAQINLWHMGEMLQNQFGCEVRFWLLEGGDLLPSYESLAPTTIGLDPDVCLQELERLAADGFEVALVNSVASGDCIPYLATAGLRIVSLVHELLGIVEEYGLRDALLNVARLSDVVVVPSEVVVQSLASAASLSDTRVVVRPQGMYQRRAASPRSRRDVRRALGIPEDHRVVLSVGSGDIRKGFDLFVHVANQVLRQDESLEFVWVGKRDSRVARWLERDLRDDVAARVHFVEFTDDVMGFFRAADVYFLASREDPFPSVVLEALSVGLPTVAFEGSGGIEPLVAAHGRVVSRGDLIDAGRAISELAHEDDATARDARQALIADKFQFDEYCFDLLRLLYPDVQKVSVAIPNFNYRDHLAGRLESVFQQTYPVFEVIVLDDASRDGSVDELERLGQSTGRRFRVDRRAKNSGSVFLQWRKGCQEARGDLLWIAEADDMSTATFLERLVPRIATSQASFGFTDSAAVDAAGAQLRDTYKDYYRLAVDDLMDSDFVMDGPEFVRRCLAERNLLLNVSAVVWRRDELATALDDAVDELRDFRLAGDWYLYNLVGLAGSKVVYVAESLNIHRRHADSVTGSLNLERHLHEVSLVHRALRERTDLSPDCIDRMASYEKTLSHQFGLVPTSGD